jgi:outer membrane protein
MKTRWNRSSSFFAAFLIDRAVIFTLALGVLFPLRALAIQSLPPPLERALQSAREHNHAVAISRAQLEEQRAAVTQALAAFTPTFQANGAYLRSQYQTSFQTPTGIGPSGVQVRTITIQPYNALTANLTLNVPLVTPSAYAHYDAARDGARAASFTERASEEDVLLQTARTYYQVVAAQGIVEAAERALATAQDGLRVAQARLAQGTETPLAVDRANVDVGQATQTLAIARQTLGVAKRSLETLTGTTFSEQFPTPGNPPPLAANEDDYVARALDRRPEVMSARAALAQQDAGVKEAWLQLAPRLTGNASEYFTNISGFLGENAYWNAGVNLTWLIDPVGTTGAIHRAKALLAEQHQRLLQTQDVVRDDVHTVWLEIEADRGRLDAAEKQARNAADALVQAKKQFLAGTSTSLEVSNAERDAFNAEASLAQARADLSGARIALEKAAGEPLL